MATQLPQTASVVADVIGRAATLALAAKCQYRHLSVPKRAIPDSHFIVRTIGRKKADALQKAFGGELLPLATCYHIHQAERDASIRDEHSAGRSPSEIAARFGLSVSHVIRITRPRYLEKNRTAARERARKQREKSNEKGKGDE